MCSATLEVKPHVYGPFWCLHVFYEQQPDLRAAGGCSVRVMPEDCCGWGAEGLGNLVAKSVNTYSASNDVYLPCPVVTDAIFDGCC